jgi:hypothetical protein
MAKYRLTGPDGAKYEVTAPDEATEEEVLARFTKEVGQALPGLAAGDRAARRYRHQLTMGLADIPSDAWGALANKATGQADDRSFYEEYKRQRALTKGNVGPSLDPRDIAADTAGQTTLAVATAPLQPFVKGYQASVGGLRYAQEQLARTLAPRSAAPEVAEQLTRKQIAQGSGRVGAVFGSAGAAGQDHESLGGALADTATHVTGGYLLGRALPGVINLADDYLVSPVRNALVARKTARAERAASVARDFEEAGIGEPPAYTMAGDTVRNVAAGLDDTLFGKSIRDTAGPRIAELEARIVQEIEAAGGVATPAAVGGRIQDFLRRVVTDKTLHGEPMAHMTPLELYELSGVPPGLHYNPSPPRVAPGMPRDVGRVTRDQVLEEAALVPEVQPRAVTSVEGRYKAPSVADVELTPELVKKVQDSHASVSDLQRRVLAEQETIAAAEQPFREEMAQLGIGEAYLSAETGTFVFPRTKGPPIQILPGGQGMGSPSPQEKDFVQRAIPFLEKRSELYKGLKKSREAAEAAQHEREIVQREAEAYRVEQLPALTKQRRVKAFQDAEAGAAAQASRDTQEARSAAVAKADAGAVAEAVRRTEAAQGAEAQRVVQETERRQAAANAEFQTQLAEARSRLGEPIRLGQSDQPYGTELDAAYEAARRNAPAVQRNPLGEKPPLPRRVPPPREGNKYQPDEIETLTEMWRYAKETGRQKAPETLVAWAIRNGGVRDDGREMRHIAGSAKQRPGLVNKNGMRLDDAALRAHEEGFIRSAERPTIAEFLDQLQDDLRFGNVVRSIDEAAAENVAVARQMANDLAEVGVWKLKTPEDVKKALASAKVKLPPPEQPPERIIEPTHTAQLLERFALEGRRKGQQTGFKPGQLFDEDGRLRKETIDYLRPKLGDEVTDLLAYLSERRAKNQFTPGMQGLQDMRTMAGQRIRGLGKDTPPELRRLYQAIDQDIDTFARGAGQRGDVYRTQREQIDRAYEQFINEIKKPLETVFGERVDSAAALATLVKDTQAKGKTDRLRAFYRVLEDKGDRLLGTGWLLNDMARGGLEGFLTAYRGLSPDARAIMFQGPARELGQRLDAMARAGGRLERYAKAARGDFKVDLRTSNVGAALFGYLNLPLAIKTAIGAEGLARLISSKWFGGWLKAYPVDKVPKSAEWQSHMARFRGLATETLGLSDATGEVLVRALSFDTVQAQLRPDIPGQLPSRPGSEMKGKGGSGGRDEKPLLAQLRPDIPGQLPSRPGSEMKGKGGSGGRDEKPLLAKFGPAVSGRKPEEAEGSGSERADNLPRVKEATDEKGFNSWWMPVQPDYTSRDDNSFKPYLPNDTRRRGGIFRDEKGEAYQAPSPYPNPIEGDKKFRQRILFGGKNAKTADNEALTKAQEAEVRGARPADTWKKFGWFKGRDGEWRNEIDDSGAKLNLPDLLKIKKKGDVSLSLGELLHHPDLFAAYPALAKVPVKIVNDWILKSPEDEKEGLEGAHGLYDDGAITIAGARNKEDVRKTLLHEVQHVIQFESEEAFDYGPDDENRGLSPERFADRYMRRHGEVEAENVSRRSGMTREQRAKSYPPSTQSVPWPKILLSPEREEEMHNAIRERRAGR